VADDVILEHLKALRRDVSGLPTRDDLAIATSSLATKSELESLRGELLRHFVEIETRMTTEVHELISLLPPPG
jgi:hypothetical protein